jgi:hypothetical protein
LVSGYLVPEQKEFGVAGESMAQGKITRAARELCDDRARGDAQRVARPRDTQPHR